MKKGARMSWDHVSSRLGNIQPATRSIAKELYDAAAAAGHDIWFMWGIGASSEHATGRALDLMVRNKAAGDFLRDYVWRNRERLRLRHVIWWQAITSTVTQPGVIRKMSDRGNSTANHKDHPHVLFLPGAYQPPPEAKPSPPTFNANPQVIKVQKALKVHADGKWGPKTDGVALQMRTASRAKRGWPNRPDLSFHIRDVQEVINTKVDGDWGPNSQSALTNWIENFQDILNVTSDGWWGNKTDGKFILIRRKYLNKY